jgi:hypothetical protein
VSPRSRRRRGELTEPSRAGPGSFTAADAVAAGGQAPAHVVQPETTSRLRVAPDLWGGARLPAGRVGSATHRQPVTSVTTEWNYDADGNTLDSCPPNEFTPAGGNARTATGILSTHVAYNATRAAGHHDHLPPTRPKWRDAAAASATNAGAIVARAPAELFNVLYNLYQSSAPGYGSSGL